MHIASLPVPRAHSASSELCTNVHSCLIAATVSLPAVLRCYAGPPSLTKRDEMGVYCSPQPHHHLYSARSVAPNRSWDQT